MHSENGDDVRPLDFDDGTSGLYVYVRRNFVLVPETEGDGTVIPSHWAWDELAVPKESWEAWEQSDMNADAMADLSGLVSDVLDTQEDYGNVIAELSELISDIISGEE